MVDILFLSVMALSLSSAIITRWYFRRSKVADRSYRGDPKSETAKGLTKLMPPKADYSSAILIVRERAREALQGGRVEKESMGDIRLLISLCDGALRKDMASHDEFTEIGSLYSQLGLGWSWEGR